MNLPRNPTPADMRRTHPSRADTSVPAYPSHPDPLCFDLPQWSRVYDYWLGGKDNFAADRALARKIEEHVPTAAQMARANRAWMHRATRYLVAQAGIRQILNLGTGFPTPPDLHEIAQQIAPHTRVVYVDNDPIVLVHAQALMISTPQGRCAYLDADIGDIDTLLHSAELTDTFDLNEPVAVMAASTLMLLSDQDDPWTITDDLRKWSPDGSYLAISHPTADTDPNAMAAVADTAGQVGIPYTPRSHAEIARMFGDWHMVEPGLAPVGAWKPDYPPDNPDAASCWAGIAHK